MRTLTNFLMQRIAEDVVRIVEPRGRTRARALAECEAKARILRLHQPPSEDEAGMGWTDQGYGGITPCCATCGTPDEYAISWPCATIKALAAIYAAHSEYREEWKP